MRDVPTSYAIDRNASETKGSHESVLWFNDRTIISLMLFSFFLNEAFSYNLSHRIEVFHIKCTSFHLQILLKESTTIWTEIQKHKSCKHENISFEVVLWSLRFMLWVLHIVLMKWNEFMQFFIFFFLFICFAYFWDPHLANFNNILIAKQPEWPLQWRD